MIKKFFLGTILLIVSLTVVYFTLFLAQNYSLAKSYSAENNVVLNTDDTKFIRCNYNILKPEFAYTFPFSDKVHISFLQSRKLFYQTEVEWDNNEIGGTTVKNTTFPQLVTMVKENCEQFQKGDRKGEMEWIYSPAKPIEEVEREKIETLEYRFSAYGDETQEAFTKVYGDIEKMTDEEKIELFDRINEEGLAPSVDNYWQVDIFLEDLHYLTQPQRDAIQNQYGKWEGVSHEEIFEWATRMKKDIEAGKFSLDDY